MEHGKQPYHLEKHALLFITDATTGRHTCIPEGMIIDFDPKDWHVGGLKGIGLALQNTYLFFIFPSMEIG